MVSEIDPEESGDDEEIKNYKKNNKNKPQKKVKKNDDAQNFQGRMKFTKDSELNEPLPE